MKFIPTNGYLRLEKLEEEEKEEQGVLLPEGCSAHPAGNPEVFKPYKTPMIRPLMQATMPPAERVVIVDDRMVEKFTFEGEQFLVVKEQYVVGEFHE